jgi:hypothetical protein
MFSLSVDAGLQGMQIQSLWRPKREGTAAFEYAWRLEYENGVWLLEKIELPWSHELS